MSQDTQLLTPVARLVQGDCFEPQKTDVEGNPLVIRTGANAGQPRVVYYMALAIPKNDPGYSEIWGKIYAEAVRSFPDLFDASGVCSNPSFAFKITDGDSITPNRKGNKPCDNDGFPGNWILHFSGGFPPAVFRRGGQTLVASPDEVKRGYYIRILGNVAGNGSKQMPGVYLNYSSIEFIGYGEEIVIGPDGSAFIEKPVTTLPPGVSATPLVPTPMAGAPPVPGATPMAGAPPVPGAAAPTPLPGAPGAAAPTPLPGAPGAVAATPVRPAPDFLNPTIIYTLPDGTKWNQAQLLQAGYTQAQIDDLIPF